MCYYHIEKEEKILLPVPVLYNFAIKPFSFSEILRLIIFLVYADRLIFATFALHLLGEAVLVVAVLAVLVLVVLVLLVLVLLDLYNTLKRM